jgi:predicted nucleic acid-binding protein
MPAPVYLADTSVPVLQTRHAAVREIFEVLSIDGRLGINQMVALEFLNNAPDPDSYEKIRAALQVLRWFEVTGPIMDRALEVHGHLAKRSQHRGFTLPGLIIAATAEKNGATVLHYDADYERIAAVTGQPVQWVAARGSL